ncbi:MAG: hypothetical protein AB7F74_17705 [Parvibaculaceae bacterium]
MPVCEADPWRLQYFEAAPCPADVMIPTEDCDAWTWYPRASWIYDKLRIAQSQGLDSGPHGIVPKRFPVFSKPIFNLKGMGVGSGALHSLAEYEASYTPGHFWTELLTGEHLSTDCAVVDGEVRWWCHTTGRPFGQNGMFDYWTVHAAHRPELEDYVGSWASRHLGHYTGMLNVETLGGRIIEAHLRFADQWPDLYGRGWVEALIRLYAEKRWHFPEEGRRRDGYSVVLFGRHGRHYRHPPADLQRAVRTMPGVTSLQITFHETRPPEDHAAPPGGFRLAIINTHDLETGFAARRRIAEAFAPEDLLWPEGARPHALTAGEP